MTNISVISPMVDKDSVSALSSMIDPENSINNLVDQAASTKRIGEWCEWMDLKVGRLCILERSHLSDLLITERDDYVIMIM